MVRQLRANVTVSDYALTTCATHPAASSVDARPVAFAFARGTDPVVQGAYSGSDAQAPWYALRGIGTRTSLANCLAGNRTDGFIDAKFDSINVNASAAP